MSLAAAHSHLSAEYLDPVDALLQRHLEVDCDSYKPPKDKSELSFWKHLYSRRLRERKRFQLFLDDTGAPVIFVTGPVGCGKTHFVKEKMLAPTDDTDGLRPPCSGVVVDLSGSNAGGRKIVDLVKRIRGLDDVDFAEDEDAIQTLYDHTADFLDALVSEWIVAHIEDQFFIHAHNNLSFEELREDLEWRVLLSCADDHPPKHRLKFPNKSQKNDLRSRIEPKMAAAIALWGSIHHHRRIFTEAVTYLEGKGVDLKQFDDAEDAKRQFRVVVRYLQENDEARNDILAVRPGADRDQLAPYWLRVLSNVLGDAKRPAILFLDNADPLPAAIHHILLRYTDDLAAASSSDPAKRAMKSTVVVALRNENVRRAGATYSRRTRIPRVIVLASFPNAEESDRKDDFIPMIDSNLDEILRTRLEYAEVKLEEHLNDRYDPSGHQGEHTREAFAAFAQVVRKIWMPFLGLEAKKERVRRLDLANESIRLALDMIRATSMECLRVVAPLKTTVSEYLRHITPRDRRAHVIDWLFKTDATGHRLVQFIEGEKRALKEGDRSCGSHRVVLTYLHNVPHKKKGEGRGGIHIKCRTLIEDIRRCFGIDDDHVRTTLWHLYQPNEDPGEFISISQVAPVGSADSISPNARIALTPRGQAYFRHFMHTVEYWAMLSAGAEHNFGPLRLMAPGTARQYFETISSEVFEIAELHLRGWDDLVLKEDGLAIADNLPFFSAYDKAGFVIGGKLYLERVADSHMWAITDYVRRRLALDIAATGLQCPRAKRFLAKLPQRSEDIGEGFDVLVRELQDEFAELCQNWADDGTPLPNEQAFTTLVDLLRQYSERQQKLTALHGRSRNDARRDQGGEA